MTIPNRRKNIALAFLASIAPMTCLADGWDNFTLENLLLAIPP